MLEHSEGFKALSFYRLEGNMALNHSNTPPMKWFYCNNTLFESLEIFLTKAFSNCSPNLELFVIDNQLKHIRPRIMADSIMLHFA